MLVLKLRLWIIMVVGVGNIYATESLFNIGVHPAQPASTLTQAQVEKLVIEVKRIWKQAIDLFHFTRL